MSTPKIFETNSEQVISTMVAARQALVKLDITEPLVNYLGRAQRWNPTQGQFPYRRSLHEIIVTETARLYSQAEVDLVSQRLQESWTVETGAHLHLPKSFDRTNDRGPAFNPLIFQGQIFWAMATSSEGGQINLSLNSGRVPPNNINSGAYLEYSQHDVPMRTVSESLHRETPQTLVPPVTPENIDKKIAQLRGLRDQKKISGEEFGLAMEIWENFLAQQGSFSDQVVTAHAQMCNRMLANTDVSQVTLDSENIGIAFLGKVLQDKNTAMNHVFADPELRQDLLEQFAGVDTAWKTGESPFYEVFLHGTGSKQVKRIRDYTGDLNPEVLAEQLQAGTLMPRGATKFLGFMMEAGLCPVGGMNQAGYGTQIRDRAAAILHQVGLSGRAESLSQMPTDTAVISPCWGIKNGETKTALLEPLSCILQPLQRDELDVVSRISGHQSLIVAAPALHLFLTEQPAAITHADVIECMSGNVVVRN